MWKVQIDPILLSGKIWLPRCPTRDLSDCMFL